MRAIGNAKANALWEAEVPLEYEHQRPTPDAEVYDAFYF